jgi:hypothetical protein
LQDTKKDLESELTAATALVAHVREKLQAMSKTLSLADSQYHRVAVGFVEACLFPRMFLSIEDAVFCSRFLILLAELKFERVSLIQITDQVIKKVGIVAMSCTPIERICLARFISDMLQYFKSVSSVKDFASVADTPAFERMVRKTGTEAIIPQAITQTKFVAFVYSLHKNLLTEIKECLSGDEAYCIQGGLMLLSHLIKMEAFPAYRQHAFDLSSAIEKRVASLDESLDGVRLTARSLLSPLSALGSLPDASLLDPTLVSVVASAPAPAPAPAEAKRKNVPIASIVPDIKAQPTSKPPPPSAPHPSEVNIDASTPAPIEKGSGPLEQSKPGPSSSAAPPSNAKSNPSHVVKSRSNADTAETSRPSSNSKADDERHLKEQKEQVMRTKHLNDKSGDGKSQSSVVDIGNKRGLDDSTKSSQQPSSQRTDPPNKVIPVQSTSAPVTANQKPSSRDEPRRDLHRDTGRAGDSGPRDASGRDVVVKQDYSGGRDGRSSGGGSVVENRDRTVVADR